MNNFPFDDGPDAILSIIPVIVFLVFVLVVGYIIFIVIKNIMEWHKNNNSPVLTVSAKIVAKRTLVNSHHHGNNDSMYSSVTTYFTTFEVESGDRMELKVSSKEYGMLAEGDMGKLTFQGTRYKGFERER